MAVSGTYKTVANSPIGKQEGLIVLEAEADALKGSITAMGNTVYIQDGKVSGDSFEFEVEVTSPMGQMTITVRGTVHGDKLTGNFITTYGQLPFEGTRIV